MRILIVNQFFWPDTAATSQFLTDLTRYLGPDHEVTVICSAGKYAESEAEGTPPPVKVIRVPGSKFKRGALARALSYSKFLIGTLWHQFRIPRPDLVITMTTPPMLSFCGTLLKIVRGSRHFIWEMDVFPDVLVSLGVLKERSLATRVLTAFENFCHFRCDGIIVLGPCMRERLIMRGVSPDLIHVAENWADSEEIEAQVPRHTGPLNILYSGNLGLCHDTATIGAAIGTFKNDPRFTFTFAGGGTGKAELEAMCRAEGIQNAHFLAYADRDQLSEHLGRASIGLVTERAEAIGTVVPSKVYGLLAAAKPILFIGPAEATPGLLVRRFGCGWQIDPGDSASLCNLLVHLERNRDAISGAGCIARIALERYFDRAEGVARIAQILALQVRPALQPTAKLQSHAAKAGGAVR